MADVGALARCQCGVEVHPRARFCPSCGRSLLAVPSPPDPTETPESTIRLRPAELRALLDEPDDVEIVLRDARRAEPAPAAVPSPVEVRLDPVPVRPWRRRSKIVGLGVLVALAVTTVLALTGDDSPSRIAFTRSDLPLDGTYRPVVGDFDGSGSDDIVWHGRGARNDWLWRFDGEEASRSSLDLDHDRAATVGDFDGDDRDDVIWADDRSSEFWFGTPDGGFDEVTGPAGGSQVVGVADIDGDGHDDLVWREDARDGEVWFGTADREFRRWNQRIPPEGSAFGADFDGDGDTDLVWASAAATTELWLGEGNGAFVVTPLALRGTVVGTGDVDGDDRDDLVVFQQGRPDVRLGTSAGRFRAASPPLPAASSVAVGDFDADGQADLLLRDTGRLAVFSDGATIDLPGGDVGLGDPIVLDADGDGATDVYWYAPGRDPDWLDVADP